MPYRYDMDRHFQLVRSKTRTGSTSYDGGSPAGRIYLDASPGGAGSIRDETSTRRFLAWVKARKRAPGPPGQK
ncbi:hypothetical protein [Maritimibacter fusiformis]|uniref:Uncharacterized protein n=1 Tax=Maritimibacter fusiformis TaxID=2603819 RepID=A0A5D0RLU6_9RHOB|nr:hypothetical protein [Maritimibacter fusiformis]TYB82423.1 hypothetical protein FVF75_06830 [Maritimibacter fusiformis]